VTPAAQLVHATKKYGAVEAVKGITLDIEPGEVVAMLGPNGAGKTTSISLMLGLRKPTSGTARLFGMDPTDRRARSRTGVMLQESGVPQVLKVSEMIDLFRSYYPSPMPTARVIELAGLEEKAQSQNKDLSGGQRQRIALARAVIRRPQLLVMDDATSAVDPAVEQQILAALREESRGTTVLVVAYRMATILLADVVVYLEEGRVVDRGTHTELLDRCAGYQRLPPAAHLEGLQAAGRPVHPTTELSRAWRDSRSDPADLPEPHQRRRAPPG